VPATLVVAPPPDFTLACAPSTVSTAPGGSVSFTVAVSPLDGFGGDVELSLAGLAPDQATWSFAPATVTGGSGSAQLTIAVSAALAPGSYPLTVTGAAKTVVHAAPATLVVEPAGDFTLELSAGAVSIARRSPATIRVSVVASGGFASPVTLSVTGLPRGVRATFSRNPVPPGRSSKLTLRATRRALPGTYTLRVSGGGGGVRNAADLTLTVRAG
jgi:hypothetical protein